METWIFSLIMLRKIINHASKERLGQDVGHTVYFKLGRIQMESSPETNIFSIIFYFCHILVLFRSAAVEYNDSIWSLFKDPLWVRDKQLLPYLVVRNPLTNLLNVR